MYKMSIRNSYSILNNTKCNRRLISGDICYKPSVNPPNLLFTLNPRCETCYNKCEPYDHTFCDQEKYHGRLCFNHYEYRRNVNIEEYNTWKSAVELHDTYVFCGFHCEKYDGDMWEIYHYISKSNLDNRNIDELGEWEYDREIWPNDRIYSYCGDNWEFCKNKYKQE